MNIEQIITEIEKKDPEVYERLSPRRKVMQQFANTSKVIALSALPLALGALFNKAYGRDTMAISDVLQYALTLEYLESEFYTNAVASGIIPAGDATAALTLIRDHEIAHVNLLKNTLTGMGVTPVSKPTFDFSAGSGSGNGPFKNVFVDYGLLLAVAQTFEDTGVRAYKGRAAELISNNAILTVALQIHSVEARHASHLRSMRRILTGNTTIKPWITGNDTGGIGPAVQASYNGEDLHVQANIEIININNTGITFNAATEAFDEPLTASAVLAIVAPFIV